MKQQRLNITAYNPAVCRAIAASSDWTTTELYPAKSNGHKFKPGDLCILTGLETYPEHNGEQVEITAIRQDGKYDKAYYIKGPINEAINWVYEYRLLANKS